MKGMYDSGVVLLSFGIAFVGSYASITACEQYRLSKIGVIFSRYIPPYVYLVAMAVCLGGVGIWCMHFIGMSAVELIDENGQVVSIKYDIGITIASLVLVIAFSSLGFYVASLDKVFMKTKREIIQMFVEDSVSMTMKEVQGMKAFQMVILIATRAPQHLLLGGFINGSGVVVMHYLGMAAMRFRGHIVWDAGVIASSAIVAFVASIAAFWILFLLLSMYPDKENLRLACAFTMAIAVCGMHYTGMVAADFVYDAEVTVDLDYTMTSTQASTGGVLAAAAVTLFVAVLAFADLRHSVLKMSTELYRADTLLKSIPATNPCAGPVKKYIAKRKANKFSLGVLNDTVNLADHEAGDDTMSVTSLDDQPNCLWYAYYRLRYRLCGAPPPPSRPLHVPYEVTSPRSDGGGSMHHYHHTLSLSRGNSAGSAAYQVPTRESSANTFATNLDSLPPNAVQHKPAAPIHTQPGGMHAPVMCSTSTSYHAPRGCTALPPLLSVPSVTNVEGFTEDGDIETGHISTEVCV